MFKNVASQKVILFAFDATTNLPKTGDAANITPYVSKDFGSVTAMTDTSATEMDATNAKGYYLVDISQTESNADVLLISAKSSTSNVSVIGAPATIFTVPPNFTSASIDSNGRVDVIKLAGTTLTARDIGASVLLSSGTGTGQLSIASGIAKVDVDTIKTQTVTCGSGVTVLASVGTAATATAQTGDVFARVTGTGAVTFASLTVSGATALTGAVTSTNASNDIRGIDIRAISGDSTAADNAESFFDGTGYAGTNNVIPLVTTTTTATTATNLTNLPAITANWLTATGIAADALTAAKFHSDVTTELQSGLATSSALAALVTTVGVAGAGLTAADDAIISAIAALNNLSAAQVNAEVVDALATDTYAEPAQGAPAATATLAAKINYLYKSWRNRKTQTSSQFSLYADDATTVDQKSAVADDGTTTSIAEIASGP